MSLAEFIDLILSFFFADNGLALVVTEALQDALVVQFHFFLLLLLLLELEAHELVLLLGHGRVLNRLALHGFVLILQVLDNLLEFLNPLSIDLIFLLLRLTLGSELDVEPGLQLFVCLRQLILRLSQLKQFAVHHLLTLVPLLSLDRQVLFIILLLVFKFKDLLTEFFDFLGQGSDFQLEFSFLLVVVGHCFNFLLFELLNELLFFFVLLLGLLS